MSPHIRNLETQMYIEQEVLRYYIAVKNFRGVQ